MSSLLLNSLGVVCPSCDFLNTVGAARCASCGAATHDSTPATKGEARSPLADAPAAPSGTSTVPPGLKRAHGVPPPDATPPSTPPSPASATGPARPSFQSSHPMPPSPAAAPASAAPAAAAGPRFGLNVLAGPALGQKFRLGANGAQIGRSKGVVLFPDDPFVSPLHATLSVRDGKVFVRDEASTSGVYVSIAGQETISPNSYFCTGLRLFRYSGALEVAPPFVPGRLIIYGAPVPPNQVHYCVEEILLGDRPGRATITAGPILTIGQAKCDMTYPGDEGLAPRHCELSPMPTGAMIRDLSGGLGTYVRVTGERALKPGDRLRVGQQTLQLEQL